MKRVLAILMSCAALAACGTEAEPLPDQPQIKPDLAQLGFGTEFGEAVFVGFKKVQTLQLTNGGKQALTLSGTPTLSGANAALFTAEVSATTAESGKTIFVQVTYRPTAAGKHNATLEIASNAENQPTLSVPLVASAVVKAPQISITPTALHFGNVAASGSKSLTIQVKNGGYEPLVLETPLISGDDAIRFHASYDLDRVDGASGVATLTVTYTPGVAGAQDATLKIRSNAENRPSIDVALDGTGQ